MRGVEGKNLGAADPLYGQLYEEMGVVDVAKIEPS